MSTGTVPIQMCDSEVGCDQWMLDYWAMTVSNWSDFLDGWAFDPYRDRDRAFCPEHRSEAEGDAR